MPSKRNRFVGVVDIIAPPIKKFYLEVEKDALLLKSEEYTNYGESRAMQVINSHDSDAAVIMNFVGLTKVPAKVLNNLVNIDLELYINGFREKHHTVNMYQYDNSNWEEIFVSWANAPTKGGHLDYIYIEKEDRIVRKDITADIKRRIANKIDNVGYYFNSDDTATRRIISIMSRESDHKPVIAFSYYDIPGSPIQKTIKGTLVRAGEMNKYINGQFKIEADRIRVEVPGDIYVPKYMAVNEKYFDSSNTLIKENVPLGHETEILDVYNPDESEYHHRDWGVQITGNMRSSKKGPVRWIMGDMVVWKGSAFKLTFKGPSDVLLYKGIETLDIAHWYSDMYLPNPTVQKSESEGDLITGTTDVIGGRTVYITGSISVARAFDGPEITGTVESLKIVDDVEITGNVLVNAGAYTEMTGSVLVPKFFVFDHKYYLLPDKTTPVFTEHKDTNVLDPANVYNKESHPSDYEDSDLEITGEIKAQGIMTTEITGRFIVVYEVPDIPKITGTTDIAVPYQEGEITGNLDIQGNTVKDITGTVTPSRKMPAKDITGEAAVILPVPSLPEIDCPSDNIVYKQIPPFMEQPSIPEIDDAQSGPYLRVVGHVFKVFIDKDTGYVSSPGTLLTGEIYVTIVSVFKWTFLDKNTFIPEVFDDKWSIMNAISKGWDKYFTVDSEGDFITGQMTAMGYVFPVITDPNTQDTRSNGDLITCSSDNVKYIKDGNGLDTIWIDDAQSGPYLRVLAKHGKTYWYKHGNPDPIHNANPEDPDIDHSDFSNKHDMEITGVIYISAKHTAWVNGTVTVGNVKEKEVDGIVNTWGVERAEIEGEVTTTAAPRKSTHICIT